jgi:hypothetical protein
MILQLETASPRVAEGAKLAQLCPADVFLLAV